MDVYVDIIFIENMILDIIILFATNIIGKIDAKKNNIIIGGIIGAIFSCVDILLINIKFGYQIIKLIAPIAMVIFAFRPKNFKNCIKDIFYFYMTSFIFGGATLAIIYCINSEKFLIYKGKIMSKYSLKIVAVGFIIAMLVIFIVYRMLQNKFNKEELLYDISIRIRNKKIKIKAMLDTGNLLKEPITNTPVIVVEKHVLNEIIPDEILENTNKILGGDLKNISAENLENYIQRMKFVPFKSVGKENGVMLGISADEVLIEKNEIDKAIIGIYDKDISRNKEYSALIGLDMLKN